MIQGMNILDRLVVTLMIFQELVVGKGSNGALHGQTKFNMDDAPSNEFFLEYIARPQTAEIFFEEVLMAVFFMVCQYYVKIINLVYCIILKIEDIEAFV